MLLKQCVSISSNKNGVIAFYKVSYVDSLQQTSTNSINQPIHISKITLAS